MGFVSDVFHMLLCLVGKVVAVLLQANVTWAPVLAEAGCYAFLEPLAKSAVRAALKSCPDAEAFVSRDACTDMRDICLTRLAVLYKRSLVSRAVRRVGLADALSLDAGGEARARTMRSIAAAVREDVMSDDGASLHERLPLAAAYERTIARNCSEALAELLVRLFRHRDDVSATLLGGQPITRIEGISAGGADPHLHGRSVMRVDTDAGSFFYKPHDCHIDGLYGELVGTWLPGCARSAALVQGDGFAFAERLVPEELPNTDGLRSYWQNLGHLTALFHALGSRDMTCDNLMCCGTRPAALDLETLLVGEVRFDGERVAKDEDVQDLTAERLAGSVACTAILPLRVGGQIVSPLVADNTSGTCLPRMGGVPATVKGFERDFSKGFEEGYRQLMGHRGEVLEMLESYEEAFCRQLLLNTWAYARFRGLLFSPGALSDLSKRDEVLAKLGGAYDIYPAEVRRAVSKTDAAALLEGDVPYYCSRVGSRVLLAGGGQPLGELLTRSAIEVAASRLAGFSEEELRFELDLIHRQLDATSLDGGES